MARKGMSGWYADIPADLKREFESLYKGRAVKRKLTIAAIRWAIKERPNLDRGTPTNTRKHLERTRSSEAGSTQEIIQTPTGGDTSGGAAASINPRTST